MSCTVFFKNIVQLFIKFRHIFVAIKSLTFCKNAKKLFYCSRELSVFGLFFGKRFVSKQDCFFVFLCIFKRLAKKLLLVYKWKLQWLPSVKDVVHVLIYPKSNKIANRFYTKSQILFKKQDNLRYVFIYKKPDTLRYAIFMEFLK